MAVRKSALDQAGLLDHWSRCFCEDTSAYGPMRAAGLRLAFVPAATQINSEPTELGDAYYFILRQLVCARLHHVYWRPTPPEPPVRLVPPSSTAAIACNGRLASTFGAATQLWKLTAFAIIPALYCAGLIAALTMGDRLVRRIVAARPPATSNRSPSSIFRSNASAA